MQFKFTTIASYSVLVLSVIATSVEAENWPGWHGPQQNGISPEVTIPLKWSDTENVQWKIPLPGDGHSSPIVWDNSILLGLLSNCHLL